LALVVTWTTATQAQCCHPLQRWNDSSHQWNEYIWQVDSAYRAHATDYLSTADTNNSVVINYNYY